MKKSIALIVSCVLLVLTLVTSCTKKEDNSWLLNLKDGQKEVPVALTIGDEEISYDLFRYWYLSFKGQMEENDSKIDWSKEENQKKLLDLTLQQIKTLKAIEDLAKKHGFELDEEEKASIDSTMASAFNGAGGADGFKAALAEKHLTAEVYERVLTANALQTSMSESLIGTDKNENKIVISFKDALNLYNKEHVRLAYVFFEVDIYDDNGSKVDEKTFEARKKAVKADADKAYNKLKNGDFLKTMKDYTNGEEANLQYYFEVANLSELFETDFSKMEVGAVTEPLFADPTYYVFYRMENDNSYLEKNVKSQVISYYAQKEIDKGISEIRNGYEIKTTDDYKLISTDTIK